MSDFSNYNKRSVTFPEGCKNLIDALRVRPLLFVSVLLLLVAGCGSRQVEQPAQPANAEGTYWQAGRRIVATARSYARQKGLGFNFTGTESMVVLQPTGSTAVAEVYFYSDDDKPALRVLIDSEGKPVGHGLFTPRREEK
jgi:hypothetical protein